MSSSSRVIKARDARLVPLGPVDGAPSKSSGSTGVAESVRIEGSARNEVAEALTRRAQALLAEAEASSQSILAEARERANKLIDEALAGVAKISEEARSLGYKDGLEAGRREASAEAEAILQKARDEAESIAAQAGEERQRILAGAKEDMISLTLAVVRRILRSEVLARPEAIGDMIKAALEKVRGQEEITVKVSTGDLPQVESRRGEWLADLPGTRSLEVKGEEGLGPGDFIIQTDQGYLDGRLERQVREIEEGLRSGDCQG